MRRDMIRRSLGTILLLPSDCGRCWCISKNLALSYHRKSGMRNYTLHISHSLFILLYTRTQVHIFIYTYIQTYTDMYTYKQTYTHLYTHTHTYIHTTYHLKLWIMLQPKVVLPLAKLLQFLAQYNLVFRFHRMRIQRDVSKIGQLVWVGDAQLAMEHVLKCKKVLIMRRWKYIIKCVCVCVFYKKEANIIKSMRIH